MTKFILPIWAMLLAPASSAAELMLLVQGNDLKGNPVRIALHSSARSFPDREDGIRTATAIAASDEVAFRFSDLPPGDYAATAFADINGNARLDKNFIGIPAEPYGFSRDARGRLGPPDFAEAAFRIGDADVTHTFNLH
ncbi:MAG: DUF2141 domain-containing protein [Gallionella sp.]|nr:DUF2141 domain-containing protein [Gallionella sp.]MCK9354164.1 DUF2141 domain-containing protein [Gallionella sp.]